MKHALITGITGQDGSYLAELLLEKGYEGYFSLEWVKRWDFTLEEPGIVFAHYANYMRKLEK